jgi:phenylacetate-CoA ligase
LGHAGLNVRAVLDHLIDIFKKTGAIDNALRYNPRHYGVVRQVLRALDTMDRDQRRGLTDRLTRRAFEWAAKLPGGLPASTPLEARPFVDKIALRDHSERFGGSGLVRIRATTSGTSGIPVNLLRSPGCIAAEQAFIDDLMGVWNYEFRSVRMARLRADNVKRQDQQDPPYGVQRNRGRRLVLSSNHLSLRTVGWFHAALESFRPELLYAHPSSGEALARFMIHHGLSLDIPLVLTSSEVLHPSGRQLMETAFKGKVIDYYGMAERVVFAAGLAPGAYYFNPAYGRVELLPIADGEAPVGYRAYEIVGTGYWNEAMPLVRYRSGDRAIVPGTYGNQDMEDVCLGLKPFISIQGRDKERLISPSGHVIIGLSHATQGVKGLLRMQVVQEAPDRAVARVVVDPRVGCIDEAQLLRNIRDWAALDINFRVETVDALEQLESGKTPFVIQRFRNGE